MIIEKNSHDLNSYTQSLELRPKGIENRFNAKGIAS